MSHTGGNAGGGGGSGGGEGGTCGWNCTTKDSVPTFFSANEKLCPKPDAAHSAPFQPSPRVSIPAAPPRPRSVMSRVHVAPSATANGKLEVYGAPPLSVVPSEQLRLQTTLSGISPPEHVISEKIDGAAGGEGGEGGEGGDGGGDGGEGGEGGKAPPPQAQHMVLEEKSMSSPYRPADVHTSISTLGGNVV